MTANAFVAYNSTTGRFEEYVDEQGNPLYAFLDNDNNGSHDAIRLQLKDGNKAWDGDQLANGAFTGLGYVAYGQREFNGTRKSNTLTGNALANSFHGHGGRDKISGDLGNDAIDGGNDNDHLDGGEGDDWINGGGGDDVIIGGKGADHIAGGPGRDRYVYNSVPDSTPEQRDVVSWKRGDRFDLAAIDANPGKKGNQAFRFIGQREFSGRIGELRATADLLQADLNGDRRTDFEIELHSTGLLQRMNLIL